MKVTVDTAARTLAIEEGGASRTIDLYGREAFEVLSGLWVKVGWNEKYTYTFSWLGRPVIQLPEDLIRAQEVVHRVRPDVIVETGVAHGGSLVFWATLLKALDHGRVIGIDVEIRPHNRAALEAHPLAPLITLVEGNSIDPAVVAKVRGLVRPGESALVLLDSNHSYAHVRSELEAYHPLVTAGSYIVATDGVAREVADTPRGNPDWVRDNPAAAAADFARAHPEFVLEQPPWPFRESGLRAPVTHWPQAWLRRRE